MLDDIKMTELDIEMKTKKKLDNNIEIDSSIKDNAKAPIKKKKKSKTPDLNINKPEIKKYIYKDENNNKYIYS